MADPKSLMSPLPAGIANLTIHVGLEDNNNAARSFPVISETLRLHSGVFNAMLRPGGPFLENGAKEVRFPKDDPDAFEIALNILHHQLGRIPEKLTLRELFNLATLADKYDLITTIRPSIPKWTSVLQESPMTWSNQLLRFIHEARITISWIFGLEQPFLMAITELTNIVALSVRNMYVHQITEDKSTCVQLDGLAESDSTLSKFEPMPFVLVADC